MTEIRDSNPGRCSVGEGPPVPLNKKAYWASQSVWTFRRRDKSM